MLLTLTLQLYQFLNANINPEPIPNHTDPNHSMPGAMWCKILVVPMSLTNAQAPSVVEPIKINKMLQRFELAVDTAQVLPMADVIVFIHCGQFKS